MRGCWVASKVFEWAALRGALPQTCSCGSDLCPGPCQDPACDRVRVRILEGLGEDEDEGEGEGKEEYGP